MHLRAIDWRKFISFFLKKEENVVKYGSNIDDLLITLVTYTKRRKNRRGGRKKLKKWFNLTIH